MIGSTVGNYRIVDRLGDGGMGAVYRAVDQMLDREVAIKVLRPELAKNAALIERFRLEAIALARLNHPRIATLHGLEKHGESFLMIMEYVRGETLEAIVQRSGQLAWNRAAELCAATLDALDHAHDKGVVHRDIKPANIMLASNGAVKVMDFGIARLVGKSRQTQVGHAVGTPMYMAPEQLRGEEVDGRTDLYATGAVLFELVTGRMAFEADSDYALMMKQLNDPPPAASAVVPGVPAAIDDIIARAMAKRREDRFKDATTFREALEHAIASFSTPTRRTPVPAETRLAAPASSASQPDAMQATAEHGLTPPGGIAATRLASPAGSQAGSQAGSSAGSPSAAPATRLVDESAAAATPETRLMSEPPIASAHSEHAGGVNSSPAHVAFGGRTNTALLRDWRTFAIAGALLVSAGLAARTLRPGPEPGRRDLPPSPDTAVIATADPQRTADSAGMVALSPARGENAASLILNPPAQGGADRPLVPRDPVPPPATRRGGGDTRDIGAQPPGGDVGTRTPPVTREPVKDVVPPPPVRDDPPRPPVVAEESEAEALAGIRDAINGAASTLSGGNTSVAASLLGGAVQEQWIALMKEGRVSMSPSGSPDVQRQGSRASATFAADVNVRSPFGANRRRSTRFSADLQRSGGAWRVVSLRPIGGLELK